MNIKQIAKLTGLTPSTIRYYEDKGLLKPYRGENNYRSFTEDDVMQLKMIVVLQYTNFNLDDISSIIKSLNAEASEACNSLVNHLFNNKIVELTNQIVHYKMIINLLKTVPLTSSSQEYHEHKDEIQNEIFTIVNKIFNDVKGENYE